jgi:hypothetical protein
MGWNFPTGDAKVTTGQSTSRFWMPPDTTRRIMFLDGEPFCFHEHSVLMGGNWRNYFVCPLKNGLESSCILCDYDKANRYYIGFLTCIDFRSWDDSRGFMHENERILYGAKIGSKERPGVLRKILRLRERYGDLTGLIFEVYRSGARSPNIGDEFTFIEKIESDKIQDYARSLGVNLEQNKWEPFNYEEVFKPLKNSQLIEILNAEKKRNGLDGFSNLVESNEDDKVPF